jgi:hypothetical protein
MNKWYTHILKWIIDTYDKDEYQNNDGEWKKLDKK